MLSALAAHFGSIRFSRRYDNFILGLVHRNFDRVFSQYQVRLDLLHSFNSPPLCLYYNTVPLIVILFAQTLLRH
jgi:hypothetical protein